MIYDLLCLVAYANVEVTRQGCVIAHNKSRRLIVRKAIPIFDLLTRYAAVPTES